MTTLKHFDDFNNFIFNHKFKDETIITSFIESRYVYIKKDSYLFKKGSVAKEFYLLLRGAVSLKGGSRRLSTIIKTSSKSHSHSQIKLSNATNKESQEQYIRECNYFGEWDLITNTFHSTSCFVLMDSVLLSFNKKTFTSYYAKKIISCRLAKKSFISTQIKSFSNISMNQFEKYFNESIKELMLKSNAIVFNEGDPATSIYLIYKGKCNIRLKKGSLPLLIHDEGDIIGLEGLFGYEQYQYTLSALYNNTIVFKIALSKVHKSFIDLLQKDLFSLFQNQKKIITEYHNRQVKLAKNYSKSYSNIFNKKANKCIKTDTDIIKEMIIRELRKAKADSHTSSLKHFEKNNNSKPKMKEWIKQPHLALRFNSNHHNPNQSVKLKKNSYKQQETITNIIQTLKTNRKGHKNDYYLFTNKTFSTKLRDLTLTNETIKRSFSREYFKQPRMKSAYTKYVSNTNHQKEYNILSRNNSKNRLVIAKNNKVVNLHINNVYYGNTNDNSKKPWSSTKEIEKHSKGRDKDFYLTLNEKVNKTISTWSNIINKISPIFQTKRFKIPLITLTTKPSKQLIYNCCPID